METEPTPPVEAAAAPAEARWYPEMEAASELDAGKESAPAEPAATAPVAGPPEKYELAMEGVQLDPAMLTAAEPVLRELGLSNEGANKLLPVATKLMTGAREQTMQAMIDAVAKQKKEWFAAFASDPQIGGAGRAETQRLAEQGLAAAGFKAGHPFRQLLNALASATTPT